VEARVEEMGAREETLRATLMTAQEVSDDLRRTAAKRPRCFAEAEVKAEKVLDAAHRRVAKADRGHPRDAPGAPRLAASVRSVIETHLSLLDGLSAELPETRSSTARSRSRRHESSARRNGPNVSEPGIADAERTAPALPRQEAGGA
jgi:hypothetical protein